MKEAQATTIAREHAAASRLTVIADSRLDELRALSSAQFDFKKLIRLCQEINTAYSEGCYFATAMLTRGLLDHVPPIFSKASFSEVANTYSGGGGVLTEKIHHPLDTPGERRAAPTTPSPHQNTNSAPPPQ